MDKLSNVTKDYLSRYYEILVQMIQGMSNVHLTDSISHNFIIQMIPHHEAAINMCHNLLQYTTNIPLQDIASNIIIEQTKSIENMNRILDNCSTVCNRNQDLALYQTRYNHIANTMFHDMKATCISNNLNADFIREMIPHHIGAIEMSKNVLNFEICSELIPIIKAIITMQQSGIKKLRQLLRCV